MSPPEQTRAPDHCTESGRYGSDEPIRRILLVAGALLAVVLTSVVVSRVLLLHGFGPPESARPLPVQPRVRLEAHPATHLEHFLREKRHARDSYGWVDREAGVAHVPVDRAMALLVESQGTKAAPHGTEKGGDS
jgi:hypothetical protein